MEISVDDVIDRWRKLVARDKDFDPKGRMLAVDMPDVIAIVQYFDDIDSFKQTIQ